MVSLFSDPRMLDHKPSPTHPERPERLAAVLRHLDRTGLSGRFPIRPVRPATDAELLRVHSAGHLAEIERSATAGGGQIEADTWVSAGSPLAARLAGRAVADVGCGSGILAVGACMMGADPVEAVDIDPLAVEVAKENAARNGVSFLALAGDGLSALPASPEGVPQDETPLGTLHTDAPRPSGKLYDLVLSNIISATLVRIAADIAAAVTPGGAWVVSGIIESNWDGVRETAEKVGFTLADVRHEDGWVAARFSRSTVE